MHKWIILWALAFMITACSKKEQLVKPRPNVIIIMTDDQGIGDFGFMGNPYIKTPTIDSLAGNSLNLTNFYVSPVCAPTRASLMTGKYSERTGIYDTYNGGATMANEEITMAEAFKAHGYRTSIFGKWHLGDNYPYRPIDQGFDVSVTHKSGGLGQPGDVMNYFAMDSSYFDPVLFRNGEPVQTYGYCSDVYTTEAIKFLSSQNEEEPFFMYLSFNAPHTPLQLPKEYYDMYKDLSFDQSAFAVKDEVVGKMSEKEIEAAKKVYGMVSNIDDNIKRLIYSLEKNKLSDNTILVFLTDNGPEQQRYKLGLKKRKSSVYEGGVRVPCLINYPTLYPKKQELLPRIAHIDLLPTLLEMCDLPAVNHAIDGMSFLHMEEARQKAFFNRTLFFEWGRGYLMKYRNFAALKGNHKLVGNTGSNATIDKFELYNLKNDPGEQVNLVQEEKDLAEQLKSEIDLWYNDIIQLENNNRNYPAIVGSKHENPVLLNRNDAKGTPPAWKKEDTPFYWDVKIVEEGKYDVAMHFIKPVTEPGNAMLKMYPYTFTRSSKAPGDSIVLENIFLNQGEFMLETYFKTNRNKHIFPFYVTLLKK
ncbi:arylsulfatase [Marinilabilia sp.]